MIIWWCFLCVLATLTQADALKGTDRCRPLQELRGINWNIISMPGAHFSQGNEYFCSPSAPIAFQCHCSVASVCAEMNDPWGRDVGVCTCCPWWMVMLFLFFGSVMLLAVIVVLYVWGCRGKWWCDGYPPPVQPVIIHRGPATVVPVGGPIPPNLFRGYRSSDFADEPTDTQEENRLTNTATATIETTTTTTSGGTEASGRAEQEGNNSQLPLRPRPPLPSAAAAVSPTSLSLSQHPSLERQSSVMQRRLSDRLNQHPPVSLASLRPRFPDGGLNSRGQPPPSSNHNKMQVPFRQSEQPNANME